MSLSTCDYCGGHIPLGLDATNRCEGCGWELYFRRDSEFVSLRAEVIKLRTDVDGLRTRNKDIYTALLAATADMRAERDRALNEREELRAENEALKKIERQRWESVNKTFGTAYSTEQANKLMNRPMNVDDFGTRRPGDF